MIKQFLAAALIVSASAAAFAQQPAEQNRPSQQTTTQDQQRPSNQFNSSAYTQVQASEIPESLRKTLEADQYEGWEEGTIFRNNNGEGFLLRTGKGTEATNYYFDKDGKAISNDAGIRNSKIDPDKTSSGSEKPK